MKYNLRIRYVTLAYLLLLLNLGCKKDLPIVIPTLSTAATSNITSTSATTGGFILSDGGSPVTVRGVCWSLNQNPTTSDNKTSNGSGNGSFASTITSLTPGETYYVRAYATNSIGNAYGN